MTAPAAPYQPDALDPTLYVRGVAHDVFRWLRENDPVHRDELNGIWVVSKYDDISYVERQPDVFSSAQGVRPKGGGADSLSIVSMDDPEHARQRRLISRGFTGARATSRRRRFPRAWPERSRSASPPCSTTSSST